MRLVVMLKMWAFFIYAFYNEMCQHLKNEASNSGN